MRYRTSVAFIIVLILAPAVAGIGVSPPRVEEYFEPGLSKYVNLKILNPGGGQVTITAYAKGDLEEYISFPSGVITMQAHEAEKIFPYRIELPNKLDKKGSLTTNIVILAIPEQGTGDTLISTNTELVSKLTLIVPINSKYAEGMVYIPGMERNKEASIVIEVRNHGTERIEEAIGVIDIVNSLGEKSAILKSEVVSLEPKEKKTLIVPWTPTIKNGIYEARLTLIYDGQNTVDKKTFAIGSPTVIINDISIDSFRLGGIAKFDILIESEWNQKIDGAYAVVNVVDKGGKVYTTFKTIDVDIDPFGKQAIQAYWDTNKVLAGEYFLEITLHYLDKKTQETRLITVSPDNIRVNAVGMTIHGDMEEGGELRMDMMLIVIILVLLAVILILLKRRK